MIVPQLAIPARLYACPAVASGTTSALNRSKKAVNVVNMENVAEHGMSYASLHRADHPPKRVEYQKASNNERAGKGWDIL